MQMLMIVYLFVRVLTFVYLFVRVLTFVYLLCSYQLNVLCTIASVLSIRSCGNAAVTHTCTRTHAHARTHAHKAFKHASNQITSTQNIVPLLSVVLFTECCCCVALSLRICLYRRISLHWGHISRYASSESKREGCGKKVFDFARCE